MAIYSPRPTICINEIEQPDDVVVDLVDISSGRSNVDEQPRAAYATINLISTDSAPIAADLNQCVRVNVLDSSGNEVTVFRGFITDVTDAVIAHGDKGYVVQTSVTAVSALARLPRFLTDASYAKQFDGDLVYDILVNSVLTSWEEWPPAETWDDVDAAVTWNTVDPEDFVEYIERPGDYEMTAYSGGEVNAQSLLDLVAKSAHGTLYETPDGYMNYESGFGRLRRVQDEGFLIVAGDYISNQGLQISKNLGQVLNYFEVTYKNDQVKSAQDDDSITAYGKQGGQLQSLLEKDYDAQALADFFIDTRANPRTSLDAFSVPLHNPALPDALRNALLGVFCGSPVVVEGLPSFINSGTFTGFIEGVKWSFTEDLAVLTANVSEYAMSAIPQSWLQFSGTILWNDVDGSTDWASAVWIG